MGAALVYQRMIEEQAAAEPKPEWGGTQRLRWALLHGQALTVEESVTAFEVGTTSLSMVIRDLRDAGFVVNQQAEGPNRVYRARIVNLEHRPVPFEPRGGAPKARRAKPKITPVTGFRKGRMAAVAQQLVAAYPEAVALGNDHSLHTAVSSLRNRHGWTIQSQGQGLYRLIDLPEGVPDPNPETPTTAVEPQLSPAAERHRAEREELDALRAFMRTAPATPALGTVMRTTMIAEDDGHAVLVLHDRAGARWFVRVEGTDAGLKL
jgi:hypothetical protein